MDEKLRILKMVEDGTITAEQAAELMTVMGVSEQGEKKEMIKNSYDKKLLRVVINSVEGDKVNIQFPVGAVKKILKVTGKLPIPEKDLEGINLTEMMDGVSECLDEELEGDLVNVEDRNGTVVRIFVGE